MTNINEYQELASRTLIDKPDFEIRDADIMLVWNALGLSGEVGEVISVLEGVALGVGDLDKLREELGDVLWYCAAIATEFGAILEVLTIADLGMIQYVYGWVLEGVALSKSAAEVCNLIKKSVFHRHSIDNQKILALLDWCIMWVHGICLKTGLSFESVMDLNIEKLKKRYPEGYTSGDSIKRVDTAEKENFIVRCPDCGSRKSAYNAIHEMNANYLMYTCRVCNRQFNQGDPASEEVAVSKKQAEEVLEGIVDEINEGKNTLVLPSTAIKYYRCSGCGLLWDEHYLSISTGCPRKCGSKDDLILVESQVTQCPKCNLYVVSGEGCAFCEHKVGGKK